MSVVNSVQAGAIDEQVINSAVYPVSTGFSADAFRANLENANPASPAYFEMIFLKMPNIFTGNGNAKLLARRDQIMASRGIRQQSWIDNFGDYRFRCMALDLPARQQESQERRYAGPARQMPNGFIYSTENVQLIEGKNLRMRELFEAWQEMCFSGADFRPQYYDDLVADLGIKVFDKSGNVVRRYKITDAWPLVISPTQLAWAERDSFMVIPIEFTFHQWFAVSSWNNTGQTGTQNLDGADSSLV